jgi:probable O-glycosylation ligase (exosortase A-associated)
VGIRDYLILAAIVVSLPVSFFRPFYGILVWVVIAFLNPHKFAYAVQDYPVALAVAIPTLAGFLIFSRDWKGLRSREFLLIVVLQIWFTITSFAAGVNPVFVHHIADTWEKWRFVSKILLMTMVAMAVVNSFYRLRILLLVVAGSFGILAAKAFPFVILTGGRFRVFGPEGSMIADNNDFGLAMNMTLPLFFFLAQTESDRRVRKLFAILFVITIPVIFFTYSRGALVGLITVGTLMFLRLRQRALLVPVIAVAVMIAVIAAPPAWKDRMDPTRDDAVDLSAKGRLNAWQYARNLAADYPITGGGFATFTPELYSRYAPPGSAIIGPHSVYFGLLAEHGYVGLCLYLALVFSCFRTANRLVKFGKRYGDQEVANYANMIRFSMVGFLMSGIFLARAYFDYFFALVACLAVLKQVAFERWAQDSSDTADLSEDAHEDGFPLLVTEN